MLAYPYNNEGDSEMNEIVIENKQPIILDNIQRLIKGMLERYYKDYSGRIKKDFVAEEGKKYFKSMSLGSSPAIGPSHGKGEPSLRDSLKSLPFQSS